MSFNVFKALSYPNNLSKKVHSEDVITAVKKTLTKYYCEAHYKDYEDIYDLNKSLFGSENYRTSMQSEKIILCEINAHLWVKAFNSAINSITKQIFPHYVIAEKFINFILNADSNENFGIIEEYFWKLLISHPPKPEMFSYYFKIMSEHFVILNGKEPEDQSVFFCLLEEISNSLKRRKIFDEANLLEAGFSIENEVCAGTLSSGVKNLEISESSKAIVNEYSNSKVKKVVYFSNLPWNEQIKRCLISLNFIYDILKTDFAFWLHLNKFNPCFANSRPLLSCMLWPNLRDVGLINKEVHKVLDLYELILRSPKLGFQRLNVIEKLVTLIGEIIRCSDFTEGVKYPFVGKKCDNFFRELTVVLQQNIINWKETLKESELVVNLKPPWLRLFLCCRLLTSVTEYQCPPDLTGVYDILEFIAHNKYISENSMTKVEKQSDLTSPRPTRKFRNSFKSINAKLRNGKTHLHTACEENNTEKIKALLTFPDIDVNAIDRNGWTPLHTAAYNGNVASVQELLSFYPKSKCNKKYVNTRARGPNSTTPLMSAAIGGHAKVCQLLLEHSGSVLLDDFNELNQTSLELSNVPEVLEVLQYYRINRLWTLHSQKNINFESDLKVVVLKLCVEMIQAYFCTFRTWDVYKSLKQPNKNSEEKSFQNEVEYNWDYMCYHRDIKTNINKLKELIPDLELIAEFKGIHEIFVRILTSPKTP